MTTFVICNNCKKKFQSPIQATNLETNVFRGNATKCPHCNQTTLVENRNMENE